MTDLDKCKRAYKLGATNEQIAIWVKAGKISAQDYKDITGEDYIIE